MNFLILSRPRVAILFFALFATVVKLSSPSVLCKGRGYRDADGSCVCSGRYYGENCEYVHCPFGPSWLAVPVEHYTRNQQFAECSDMGHCDMLSGICKCRDGYEGAACERIGCPMSSDNATYTTLPTGLYINEGGDGLGFVDSAGVPLGVPSIPRGAVCSGHGLCRTLREAGSFFDGLQLQRPPVNYDNWDADRISGCLCDPGYGGIACEKRQCPHGLNPLDPASFYAKRETFVIHCRANAGHFAIQVLGRTTGPIPWDADPATLRHILRSSLAGLGSQRYFADDVSVQMQANNVTGVATVCREDRVTETQIVLSASPGPMPPMRLLRATANNRRWPQGSQRLRLHDDENAAFLRMASQHYLYCPACGFDADCHQGQIHLRYLDELTAAVNVSDNNAAVQLQRAVWGLLSLRRAGYANLQVNVTAYDSDSGDPTTRNNRLCRETADTTTVITLYSDYGNVQPALQLVVGGSLARQRALNVSLSDNTGNGTLWECSGQGVCDANVGLCKCLQQYNAASETADFSVVSSNGQRNAAAATGTRGDCGYVLRAPQTCLAAMSPVSRLTDRRPCSGHGVCQNATSSEGVYCLCEDGFLGVDCSLRTCPVGRSFFDEPLFNDTAHRASVECSGNGDCDRRSGLCRCREGFTGAACDIKDCARDAATGVPCSGRGRCLSVRSFFALFGLRYGNVTFGQTATGVLTSDKRGFPGNVARNYQRNKLAASSVAAGNWEADLWFECVCAASLTPAPADAPRLRDNGRSLVADPQRPVTGPRREVSGYSYGSRPLPGFASFDCSQFRCPTGDFDAALFRSTELEVQKVVCTWRESFNSSVSSFSLAMPGTGQRSLPIAFNASSADIARAISQMAAIGNVSVAFFYTGDDDDDSSSYAACSSLYNATYGGFFVRFETDAGAMPLMTVHESVFDGNITISRLQAGNSTAEECGGPRRGFCNRRTGQCLCNRGFSSSSGAGNYPGARGDCSYFSGASEDYGASDDPFRRFFGRDSAGDRRDGVNGADSRRARATRELNQ